MGEVFKDLSEGDTFGSGFPLLQGEHSNTFLFSIFTDNQTVDLNETKSTGVE